eukprot:5962937-Pleurochrysis_carterae.AAC.2
MNEERAEAEAEGSRKAVLEEVEVEVPAAARCASQGKLLRADLKVSANVFRGPALSPSINVNTRAASVCFSSTAFSMLPSSKKSLGPPVKSRTTCEPACQDDGESKKLYANDACVPGLRDYAIERLVELGFARSTYVAAATHAEGAQGIRRPVRDSARSIALLQQAVRNMSRLAVCATRFFHAKRARLALAQLAVLCRVGRIAEPFAPLLVCVF